VSDETVISFFAAIEAGDIDAVREIYAKRSSIRAAREALSG
jgi:hypothetical protein